MAQPLDPKDLVPLKELLIANSIQIDRVTQLLIEAGVITEKKFFSRPNTREGRAMLEKIISRGQTGADRAALDFAIKHKIHHGGWIPKGRLAEDGPLWIGSSTVEAGLSKWLIQGLQKDDGSCGAMLIS